VLLKGGRYRFEGQVRTAGVEAVRDERGAGAGLRISGARMPRINQAGGDSPWRLLVYEFDVTGGEAEVVLVCELRATKGEAWFDVASLKLRKL
jgi:hypothetical protein